MTTSQPTSRGANILLVDDTPENLRLLSQILAERSYQVRAVTSGERALESVKLAPPDLILLDIRMPGIDGFEVCRALKADPTTQHIPVIFISALDDLEDKMRAFTVGGVDYITKPFQYEEVIARAETHLALRRLQQEMEEVNCKMARELSLAGEVQATFLPTLIPEVPGWQFAVSLVPASETSGDFFDIFTLPDGRIGLLVADVVNKGVCAALFMALSYALFRTHATQYPDAPEQVFTAVNNHILHDTNAQQFVTVFYGILDPRTGRLVYSNAGHCPPLCIAPNNGRAATWLTNTGVPLGLFDDLTWARQEVQLSPQDLLVLYTDGVIEAEDDARKDLFGRARLLERVRRHVGEPAAAVKDAILADVRQFTGLAPLSDDVVVFVVARDGG